jgi:nucleoside-diphosphate kinase
VEQNLIGKIIGRFENEGFTVESLVMLNMDTEYVEEFYAVHKDKDFFRRNVDFVASGPIVAMILGGEENIINNVRKIIGSTFDPEPGTIRHEFGVHNEETLVHASDSQEAFEYELDVVIKALSFENVKEKEV